MKTSTLACVVIANNDTMLARAIESIRCHVDDVFVLVDDRADASVTRLLTGLGVRHQLSPWPDDFGLAINIARDLAGADWSILLDSDEMILPDQAAKLRPLIARAESEGLAGYYSVQRHWLDLAMTEEYLAFGPCWPPRIFRRDVRLIGRVHQHAEPGLVKCGLTIEHFNMALNTPEAMAAKVRYYERLETMDNGAGDDEAGA